MPSDYGIKVTKDGYDVASAAIINQVFNSSLNTMKTSYRGIVYSEASGIRTVLLSSLAYKCGFLAWFEIAGSGIWYPCGDSVNGEYAACYITSSSSLKADIYTASNKEVAVKYILLTDPSI